MVDAPVAISGLSTTDEARVVLWNPPRLAHVPVGPFLGSRQRRFATLAALKATPAAVFSTGEVVFVEGRAAAGDGGGGLYRYSSADLSADFVRETISVASGEINTTANKIEKTAHGLFTCMACLVTGGNGLTANTTVYYLRGRLDDEFTFHPTFADARAGTNTVDLSGTTAFSVKVLADPDQAALVTLTGKSLDGSEGGFIHDDVAKRNLWRVEWFPGSGPDDTDQIWRAVLAGGEDTKATIWFPDEEFTYSNRDTEFPCFWHLSGQHWTCNYRDSCVLKLSSSETDTRYSFWYKAGARHTKMSNLCFDGNRDNITPDAGIDLYSHLAMIIGASGGEQQRWTDITIRNNWGRGLQTGFESLDVYSINPQVEGVVVENNGTKAISLTRSYGGFIKGCEVEVNAYTAAENPAGTEAASGSCYELNYCYDGTVMNNRGTQIGATVRGPGIRAVNDGANQKVIGNSVDGAYYGLFIASVQNYEAHGNILRDITGNGIVIYDADVDETVPTIGIRIHNNKIVDPAVAFVATQAIKDGMNAYVEAFIYDNIFEKTASGSPSYIIYNYGLDTVDTLGGYCEVYAWNNTLLNTGSLALKAGPAAGEIMPAPNTGWQIVAQEAGVIYTLENTTTLTTMKSVTIPAWTIGANGRYRVTAHFTFTNTTASNKTWHIRHDSVQVLAAAFTANTQVRAQVEIANQNSLSSQLISIPGTSYGFGPSNTALLEGTVNTGADKTISFTGQLADATDKMVLRSYVIEAYFQK